MSGAPAQPPPDVVALAQARADARKARDFARADALRAELSDQGWVVRDGPAGFVLEPAPPFPVAASVAELPDRSADADTHAASLAVLVEGFPDDVRRCLQALLAFAPADSRVLALDLGNVDGAGEALHEFVRSAPDRVTAWHVPAGVGFAAARNALARADTARAHVWVDPSVEFRGDAVTPLLAALGSAPAVAAAGGFGVFLEDGWHGFAAAPADYFGPVDALNGYLVAFRRAALLRVGVHPKARFYRNADLELGFALRAELGTAGRSVQVPGLPLELHRHRGFYDTDPQLRDRESKRTYDRFLQRFRGRDELREDRPTRR